MTRRRFLLGAAAAGVATVAALELFTSRREGGPATAPLSERATFGVNAALDDSTPVNGSLVDLERQFAYVFPLVGTFFNFDTEWSTHRPSLAQLGTDDTSLMVAWMPKSQFGTITLADIPAGRYDSHVTQMLTGMRQYRGTVVVRFGHEMNGDWYPWSVAYTRAGLPNGGCDTPQDYIAAWRYIVDRERALPGESNVRWFWCPSAVDGGASSTSTSPSSDPAVPLESYWPGSAWVDIIGADGYNEPTDWTWFDDVFADPYERISRLDPSTPFWVGETGCHEAIPGHPGTKAEWLSRMFGSRSFPRMQAVCYFDYDATSAGRADWSFTSSPAAYAAARHDFSHITPRPLQL